MRGFMLHKLLGMSVLGVSLIAGCRHCRCCDSCCEVVCTSSKAVAVTEPETSPYSPVVLPPPKAEAEPEAKPEAKPVVQPVVARETKDDYESVLMTTMAPEASGNGTIGGTVCLTPAEAKAMGIRPGFTPGALAVPPKAQVATKPPAVIQATPTGGDVTPAFPAPPKDEE